MTNSNGWKNDMHYIHNNSTMWPSLFNVFIYWFIFKFKLEWELLSYPHTVLWSGHGRIRFPRPQNSDPLCKKKKQRDMGSGLVPTQITLGTGTENPRRDEFPWVKWTTEILIIPLWTKKSSQRNNNVEKILSLRGKISGTTNSSRTVSIKEQ